jgi:hypothetical protein
MAGNRVNALGRQLYTFPTNGGATSGAPCRVGNIPGVALVDQDTNSGTTVDFAGVYALSVAGINDSGNVAVAVGDPIFYVDADTPKLSKKAAAGYYFGTAMGPSTGTNDGTTLANLVTSGATATIAVRIGPSPGAVGGLNTVGTTVIGAGTVTHADLAANAVQADVIQAGAVVAAGIGTAAVTGIKLGTGILHFGLYAGTASGANITGVTGMTAADEVVSVMSFTTAASIATVADRTSEYAAGAGVLTKAAGTNETNNQILAIWLTHH